MERETEDRRKILGFFWLRLMGFTAVAVVMLTYATYVLTPKYDYGICSMVNMYRQPQDSVDVLTVGTSLAYAGINTNVLWCEFGIASYNLCSAEQPFWVSYYTLREVLKTQHPRVVLLDAKPSVYKRDYSKRGRTILSTYGIRGFENRLGATLASVESPWDAVDYMLGLPQVHSNYERVAGNDFIFPPNNGGRGENWKGYIELDAVEHHQRPSVLQTNVRRNMNPKEEEYARKIFELCRDEGIELMLIGIPNPDYEIDHMHYNALWSVAGEYGIKGINYNDPNLRFGLRYSSDFADWQHLNVKGSMTFTRKLGEDLKKMYDLPDRRGDDAYESYESCAEEWYDRYPFFESAALS